MSQDYAPRLIRAALVVAVGGCLLWWLIRHYVLLHIHTYETSAVRLSNGGQVTASVHPQNRITVDYPERLVGPPFHVSLKVTDPEGKATSATLHSVGIVSDAGAAIPGKVTNGRGELGRRPDGMRFTLLYAEFLDDGWGDRPTLVAEIALESPGGSVRERVSIPLRARHTTDLYIP